jgi:predicted lactoylglutathione lyase
MIGYVTLGTNDFPRAAAFYDALCKEMGATRVMESDKFMGWGKDMTKALLMLFIPVNGEPATAGNGTMVALQAESEEEIQRWHAKALELGGTDEGAPGPRGDSFYAAYFRDLDGNKLAFYRVR